MRIVCLHTADSNIEVYEQVKRPAAVRLEHWVRADLLAAAEREGGLTDEVERQGVAALLEAAVGSDAVLMTCSTLGPTVAAAKRRVGLPMLSADGALAKAAVAAGGEIVVLCTAEITLGQTKALFEETARESSARPEVRLIEGAWRTFRTGDSERYFNMVAIAADQAHEEGADTIVFAQSSMAPAARLCQKARPLVSPEAGLAAAIAAASRGSAGP